MGRSFPRSYLPPFTRGSLKCWQRKIIKTYMCLCVYVSMVLISVCVFTDSTSYSTTGIRNLKKHVTTPSFQLQMKKLKSKNVLAYPDLNNSDLQPGGYYPSLLAAWSGPFPLCDSCFQKIQEDYLLKIIGNYCVPVSLSLLISLLPSLCLSLLLIKTESK